MYNSERYDQRQYISDLDDLVQRCIGTIERLKKDLGSSMYDHFPNIRASRVHKLEALERALPRLKNYFNNKLETLRYE